MQFTQELANNTVIYVSSSVGLDFGHEKGESNSGLVAEQKNANVVHVRYMYGVYCIGMSNVCMNVYIVIHSIIIIIRFLFWTFLLLLY